MTPLGPVVLYLTIVITCIEIKVEATSFYKAIKLHILFKIQLQADSNKMNIKLNNLSLYDLDFKHSTHVICNKGMLRLTCDSQVNSNNHQMNFQHHAMIFISI